MSSEEKLQRKKIQASRVSLQNRETLCVPQFKGISKKKKKNDQF